MCGKKYLPTSRGSAYKRSVIPHLRQMFCGQNRKTECNVIIFIHWCIWRQSDHLILRLPTLLIWLLMDECYTLSLIGRSTLSIYHIYTCWVQWSVKHKKWHLLTCLPDTQKNMVTHIVVDHRSTAGKQAGLATACLDHSFGTRWRIIGH